MKKFVRSGITAIFLFLPFYSLYADEDMAAVYGNVSSNSASSSIVENDSSKNSADSIEEQAALEEEIFEQNLMQSTLNDTEDRQLQDTVNQSAESTESNENTGTLQQSNEPVIEYTIDPDNYSVPEPARKKLDIAGADQQLTQKFITQYQTNLNRQWIAQCLANSVPYRPYIRQKLEESGMPLVLQYLPIVESNYKSNAVSRAGATGMWQFMENSMSPFLKKNSWYDERKDPWLSTDAALKKLKDNYKTFGDWPIAIAAYNCGAGAMKRILKQHPGKDFWYLAEHGYLRQQTALYVPKLLAIAELVENAEYYGVLEIGAADKMIEDTAPDKYDYVTVAGMLSLNQISQITGIERNTLDFLNPGLLRGCTPAGEKYALRLPEGTGLAAETALRENSIPTDAIIYTVKQGDSLWAISRKYGVSVADLCTVNGIKENGILSIGQKIIIPVFK